MSDLKIELDMTALEKGVNDAMFTWRKEAKRISPVGKYPQGGSMRKSIGFVVEKLINGFKGTIGTFAAHLRRAKNFHYPFAVHNGISKPYEIKPRNKKALHFMAGGESIFAKKVRIPARKGFPFFDISYESKKDEMNKRILRGVKLK